MSAGTFNQWKQSGLLYFWRYTENVRNYPGWHLAADEAGLAALTDLLRRLLGADDSATRTTRISPPSPVVLATANNRRSPVVSPERVSWTVSATDDDWHFDERAAVLALRLGRHKVARMLQWLSNPHRAFDTTYGTSPPIWFWGTIVAAQHRIGR
jgi:hypothetical protein